MRFSWSVRLLGVYGLLVLLSPMLSSGEPAARPHYDKDAICVECVDPRNHDPVYVAVEDKTVPRGYLFTCPGGTRGFLAEKVWRDSFEKIVEALEGSGSHLQRAVFVNHTDCQYCKKENVTDEQHRVEIRDVAEWFKEYNERRVKKLRKPFLTLELWNHKMEKNTLELVLKIKLW